MTKTININKPFPTADEREPMRIFPIGWRIPIGGFVPGDKEEWIVLEVARENGEHLMSQHRMHITRVQDTLSASAQEWQQRPTAPGTQGADEQVKIALLPQHFPRLCICALDQWRPVTESTLQQENPANPPRERPPHALCVCARLPISPCLRIQAENRESALTKVD